MKSASIWRSGAPAAKCARIVLRSVFLNFVMSGLALAQSCELPRSSLNARELVQRVLSCHPGLASQSSLVEARKSALAYSDAIDDPVLVYAFSPLTLGNPLDTRQRLEISQRLLWPGKRALLRARSAGLRDAQLAIRDRESVNLALLARYTYAQWYYLREALVINHSQQALWEEFIRIAEVKYATGSGSKQDVLQAQTAAKLLDHRHIVLQAKQKSTQGQLNRLVNQPPSTPVGPAAQFAIPQLMASVVQDAIDSQPIVQELSAQLSSKTAERRYAEKDSMPDFRLNAGYNNLWNDVDKRFTFGISINIPLNNHKRRHKVVGLKAQEQAIQWQMQDARIELTQAINEAHINWQESLHVLSLFTDELLPLAKQSLTTASDEYQSGSGDFLTLLSTEKTLGQTRLETLEAGKNILLRYADVLAARGLSTIHVTNTDNLESTQ